MDFAKYVALLQSRSLYFARADQFDDPFEGASPQTKVAQRSQWYSAPEWQTENGSKAVAMMPQIYESSRRWTYISCWHANEMESAAMWRLYARSHEAIA